LTEVEKLKTQKVAEMQQLLESLQADRQRIAALEHQLAASTGDLTDTTQLRDLLTRTRNELERARNEREREQSRVAELTETLEVIQVKLQHSNAELYVRDRDLVREQLKSAVLTFVNINNVDRRIRSIELQIAAFRQEIQDQPDSRHRPKLDALVQQAESVASDLRRTNTVNFDAYVQDIKELADRGLGAVNKARPAVSDYFERQALAIITLAQAAVFANVEEAARLRGAVPQSRLNRWLEAMK
jgi:chromosome segregation ATPase